MQTIRGSILRVQYQQQDTRFAILQFLTDEGDVICILGDIADPSSGELLQCWGDWVSHPKFGRQFKFTRFERVLPTTIDTILHYIVKVANWVGPAVGKKITEAYGDATLTVLKDEPERVAADINGITLKRANEISAALRGNEDEERMALQMGALCGGCVSDAVITAAKKRWKDCVGEIKECPYVLMQIPGCGFAGADRVAAKLGIVGDDPVRMVYATQAVLREAASITGHTWLTDAQVAGGLMELTGHSDTSIAAKAKNEKLHLDINGDWSLTDHYMAESCIASEIRRLTAGACTLPVITWKTEGWADDQKGAIKTLITAPVALLVGPPGTGKTWTLGQFVGGLNNEGLRIALAAPTGKAAKRMTEAMAATGLTACTIHRLLEPTINAYGQMIFNRGPANPIEAQLLIVDETSMLDVPLAAQLLAALPSSCRVIMVGDEHQLPSVGAGAVLRDLLASAMVPVARLTEIKRNKGDIVRGCHALFKGKTPKPVADPLNLESGHNWRHFENTDPDDIAAIVTRLATEWAEQQKFARPDVMIITPFNHKNPRSLSCMDFNNRVQAVVNPKNGREGMAGGILIGDRVVRLSNAMVETTGGEKVLIVNGDMGVVTDMDKRFVVVDFENPARTVKLGRGDADLALAYSLTCHKMQGSEARLVILPLHPSFGPFPCREWIYTAFSRAKDVLLTVGTLAVMSRWAGRSVRGDRQTKLEGMLREIVSDATNPV